MTIRRRLARLIDPLSVDYDVLLQEQASRRRLIANLDKARAARSGAFRHLDDLAIRTLSAALAIGRLAQVEVTSTTDYQGTEAYDRDSVDRLLDVARQALTEADEAARYASYARRVARTANGSDPGLDANTLRGTLNRVRTYAGEARTWLDDPETPDHVAFDHATELLDRIVGLVDGAIRTRPEPWKADAPTIDETAGMHGMDTPTPEQIRDGGGTMAQVWDALHRDGRLNDLDV